jgi:uncharacterized damage-inducible protein DinB
MKDSKAMPGTLAHVWDVNNRVNLRLLDALSDEQLAATILPRGKSVASYFVHIHMARYYWLERRDRDLAKRVKKLPGGTAPRSTLRQALIDSGKAIAEFLTEAESTGKVKSSKLGPIGFLGYALAHEGHHRGQILLQLKIAKMPLDRAASYTLWIWDKA